MHQYNEAIAVIRRKGPKSAQGTIPGIIINAPMGKAVKDLYRTSAKYAAEKYHADIAKYFFGRQFNEMKAGSFGSDPNFIDAVIEYLDKFLLNKVVLPISKTTIAEIERVLQEAVANGWGVERTVAELDAPRLAASRARTIIRTETVRSVNVTQMAAADNELYEMEKEWIAIEDDRTRPSHSHAGVDGEQKPLYEKYSNDLLFPGDPNGDAAEVINCRCTQAYFGKRDKNNNLVAKTDHGRNFHTSLNLGSL